MNEPSLKHPGRWIWLFLLVPAALGLLRLRFDVDVLDLLPPDIEAVQGLKLYQQHFANARELLITLECQSAEGGEKAAGPLAKDDQYQDSHQDGQVKNGHQVSVDSFVVEQGGGDIQRKIRHIQKILQP